MAVATTRTLISPNKHTGRVEPVRYIVIHTTENDQKSGTAWNVANYFANPAVKASSHLVIDDVDTVRVVEDKDTAWAAPGANAAGLQIELVGRAAQTPEQWRTPFAKAQLERAAQATAEWVKTYQIPVKRLSIQELTNTKVKGFIGHVDASNAFKKSTHTDPGNGFPWTDFLHRVNEIINNVPDPKIVPSATIVATSQLEVDGKWGAATTKRLQTILGTPVDAEISNQIKNAANVNVTTAKWTTDIHSKGSTCVKVLQTRLGILTPDGLLGPNTVQLWQKKLKVKETHVLDVVTIKAIQTALNNGQVW